VYPPITTITSSPARNDNITFLTMWTYYYFNTRCILVKYTACYIITFRSLYIICTLFNHGASLHLSCFEIRVSLIFEYSNETYRFFRKKKNRYKIAISSHVRTTSTPHSHPCQRQLLLIFKRDDDLLAWYAWYLYTTV